MAKKSEKRIKAEIKRDILEQLERNGTFGDYYLNLIEDYMELWDTKQELIKDIRERGVKVEKLDSKGQEQIVNNESIDQVLKINTQMLRILECLGIRASDIKAPGGDEDDL